MDALLESEEIDFKELKNMAFAGSVGPFKRPNKFHTNHIKHIKRFPGLPEGAGRRALCWRLLLRLLPTKRKQWKDEMHQQRKLYQQFLGKKEKYNTCTWYSIKLFQNTNTTAVL